MKGQDSISSYRYSGARSYLMRAIRVVLYRMKPNTGVIKPRLFDLGCGHDGVAVSIEEEGWDTIGVIPISEGISAANRAYPDLHMQRAQP